MVVRSSHIITLSSGNLARDFRWESLGYGRVRVQYNYTDRRSANGLDIDDKFREYFDFEDYWHNNGGETITTSYGVYMVDTKGLAYWLKELAAY